MKKCRKPGSACPQQQKRKKKDLVVVNLNPRGGKEKASHCLRRSGKGKGRKGSCGPYEERGLLGDKRKGVAARKGSGTAKHRRGMKGIKGKATPSCEKWGGSPPEAKQEGRWEKRRVTRVFLSEKERGHSTPEESQSCHPPRIGE